jgi:hypothetical protein
MKDFKNRQNYEEGESIPRSEGGYIQKRKLEDGQRLKSNIVHALCVENPSNPGITKVRFTRLNFVLEHAPIGSTLRRDPKWRSSQSQCSL